MQVHGDDVIGSGHREHIGDQFGGDWGAALQDNGFETRTVATQQAYGWRAKEIDAHLQDCHYVRKSIFFTVSLVCAVQCVSFLKRVALLI